MSDWEELDIGELYLKKVRSSAPQRGTDASAGKPKELTPEQYDKALKAEASNRMAALKQSEADRKNKAPKAHPLKPTK
jgi:hypothetical protein